MKIELNTIYNMDCLEGMKHIPDQSIDMILCDLPYGTTQNSWDSCIDLTKLWSEYKRICKGAIVLFAQTPFDKVLGCSNLKMLKYEWVWEKENSATGFLNAKKAPLKYHENILVFYKRPPAYNPIFTEGKPYKSISSANSSNYGKNERTVTENTGFRYPKTILKFKRDSVKLHPTQKPVALLEYLIKTYTNEGNTVLDNCMGSGTTALAAINTGRNFIGFELDTTYYDIANKRIEGNLYGR